MKTEKQQQAICPCCQKVISSQDSYRTEYSAVPNMLGEYRTLYYHSDCYYARFFG